MSTPISHLSLHRGYPPEFKLYIIKDYTRLKSDENSRLSLGWNLNREISKLNYRIHTDAIKDNLLPPELISAQMSYTYASEADVLKHKKMKKRAFFIAFCESY